MTLLFVFACASAPEADAAPFVGALAALDVDHDGVVAVEEYPASPTGGAPAADVDRNHDGRIAAEEVRDEVFAVDPTRFDSMAWSHGTGGGRTATSELPPPGPLAEALRFLRDLAATRSPGAPLPTDPMIAAAARSGMESEAGTEVIALLTAAGAPPPASMIRAAADPPAAPPGQDGPRRQGDRPALRNDGPGGPGAVRERGGKGPRSPGARRPPARPPGEAGR
jgi:hypothetical protein